MNTKKFIRCVNALPHYKCIEDVEHDTNVGFTIDFFSEQIAFIGDGGLTLKSAFVVNCPEDAQFLAICSQYLQAKHHWKRPKPEWFDQSVNYPTNTVTFTPSIALLKMFINYINVLQTYQKRYQPEQPSDTFLEALKQRLIKKTTKASDEHDNN